GVRRVPSRINALVQRPEADSERAIDELARSSADDHVPPVPRQRIRLCAVPLEVIPVAGIELGPLARVRSVRIEDCAVVRDRREARVNGCLDVLPGALLA